MDDDRFDVTGKRLMVGDWVVYSDTKRETSRLLTGVIAGFSTKKVILEVANEKWKIEAGKPELVYIKKFPEQIAKVEPV